MTWSNRMRTTARGLQSRLSPPAAGRQERADGTIHPDITVVPDDEFRELERPSLNRLCNAMDWVPWGELSNTMVEMRDAVCIHRKSWEYAVCVHGLRSLGVVTPDAKAIAVGAGYERPLFLFANEIERMVATDLYDGPER